MENRVPATAALFRQLALSLPGAIESAHCNHPDFRLNNRIFATLAFQAKGCGVLILTPEQQSHFVTDLPEVFEPVPGGWGRHGCTLVHLEAVSDHTLLGGLTTAYRNVEAKQAARKRKRTVKQAREEL